MSIQTADDLDLMPSLDSSPQCESEGAEFIHGEGEDAVAITRVRCPHCAYTDSALMGAGCVQMLRQCIAEGLVESCMQCLGPIEGQHFSVVML